MKAAWSGLGMKCLAWLTHPTCTKSQSQMRPGPQTPQEHWALTVGSAGPGTLLDAVLGMIQPLLRVITLPVPSVGCFSPDHGKP